MTLTSAFALRALGLGLGLFVAAPASDGDAGKSEAPSEAVGDREPGADPGDASETEGRGGPLQRPVVEADSAREAFDSGLEAVAAGEYDAAVVAFETAYALDPHPVTLFNLALALERAGREPEAWELFTATLDIVDSDAERQEIRDHLRELDRTVAVIEVAATPRYRVCIDGAAMPQRRGGRYRLALAPGEHALLVDRDRLELELRPGERRIVLLEDYAAPSSTHARGPLMPAMLGTAIGTGAAAVGLGVGAIVAPNDGVRTGLGAGAAASAGVALTTSLVALLIESRKIRELERRQRAPEPEAAPPCPGSTEIDQRLDLRIVPNVARPASFPALELAPEPEPREAAQAFPHPRSLRPGREQARAQNRAESATP